jgi:hypothetical protein
LGAAIPNDGVARKVCAVIEVSPLLLFLQESSGPADHAGSESADAAAPADHPILRHPCAYRRI